MLISLFHLVPPLRHHHRLLLLLLLLLRLLVFISVQLLPDRQRFSFHIDCLYYFSSLLSSLLSRVFKDSTI